MSADRISRFLCLGSAPAEGVANLQLIVNETAGPTRAAAYVFVDADRSEPYLIVLDRLAALQGHRADLASSQPFDRVVGLATRGGRFPRLVAVTDHGDHAFGPFLARACAHRQLLPAGLVSDKRLDDEFHGFLHREPAIPCPVADPDTERTLVIAMPWLTYGGADFAVRILLEEGAIRTRFDRVVILTFECDDHRAHALFEPLTDAIHHLGGLGGDEERRLAIALTLLESSGASDFLIVNSRHGYELIPRIRAAKIPVRISAQLHGLKWNHQTGTLSEGYPKLLASQYAVLVDRVASISDWVTAHMVEHLYFPRQKIRTVRLGVDQGKFRPGAARQTSVPRQVVWCGRLCFEKDPVLALRVAERFQEQDPDVAFVFVGDGPEVPRFAEAFHARKAAGARIAWIPKTDHMDRIYQDADCLFMTSVYEGVPLVVMEAASTGLPVVMSFKHTFVGEVVEHGQFLEVTNRQDVDEYCRRLHEALAAPPRAPSPIFSHHRYAQEMIDWLFSDDGSAPARLDVAFGINHAA